MTTSAQWLIDVGTAAKDRPDGLVPVAGYHPTGRPPDEVIIVEKAASFGAHAVFFEAGRNDRAPIAQAFIFVSNGPANDPDFGEIHRRLWSWGGVPLVYRKTPGLVQLFRCAHKPDFISSSGATVCHPFRTLQTAAAISSDPWWDASRLRNGTLWDDPEVCKLMLSASKAAHKRLFNAVKKLNDDLNEEGVLRKRLRRKLLILSLLIAYLEERGVFPENYFDQFSRGAKRFFEVLADGAALVKLLANLEERFNGNVFVLDDADRASLTSSSQLLRFARLVEGHQEESGQLTLWQLYSFKDLPVELISHIYQLFVKDTDTGVYTPPFLVRLMLDEALSWNRLDLLQQTSQIILDPCCGSGIFLVEAYKRLVLHWRSRNEWKQPTVTVLNSLLKKVHGIDLEEGAIELAAFSLCLALCDALEPETIRASIKLFPLLANKTLHQSCFFAAKDLRLVREPVGVVVGNPPFTSNLNTPTAEQSYGRYVEAHGYLPDKQLAYLVLHEAMEMVAAGGVLSMLQQYNFLYNQQSIDFRRTFMARWDVREVLDFISVRGLFQKGDADTKVVVILAEAKAAPADRRILHATFRRSGRIDAEQGFDIDYYDMHWVPRDFALRNDGIWRANLLGGGRVLGLVDRLKEFRTIGQYADEKGWECGEGFIVGKSGKRQPAKHLTGKPLLPAEALSESGVDRAKLEVVTDRLFKTAYSAARYSPPMLLIREQADLGHALWTDSYLTYKNKVVGICAPPKELSELRRLHRWVETQHKALKFFAAAISVRMFTQRSTTLSEVDILSLPYPRSGDLDCSLNEEIIIDDVSDYYGELVRLGEDSAVMKNGGLDALGNFNSVFMEQVNAIYKKTPLHHLDAYSWPGLICQPLAFGNGKIDWVGADQLRNKLDALLYERQNTNLHVTRIARIYDGNFIFLLKPDRLRYWLRSVALRDADETLSELRAQGF
jgi:hypothetical protein